MLCRTCGNLLVRGQTICDMCGESVETVSTQFNGTAHIAKPRRGIQAPRPAINPMQSLSTMHDVPSVSTKPETSRRKYAFIVSMICASSAIVIGGCTLAFLKIFGFI